MSTKHKHEKKTNVINRTTSETLRLGEVQPVPSLPQVSRKKIQNSSSSFQITAVTRTDGDDSADDLDTDDISRVTDNETPSFSEDSRDTDDHHSEPAAVEPMQVDFKPKPAPAEPMQVDVKPKPATEEPMQVDVKPKPPDERFKIVKVPSTLPLSRGRWVCVDYFDEAAETGLKPEHSSTSHPGDAYSSHFAMQPNLNVATKPAGTMKGFPQGFSSTLASNGADTASFTDQEMAQAQPQAANQPSTGQKGDILSDIKVALTSAPATNSRSAPNNNNIDRKIEEALDAVKTHLMLAVHKEVDFLKTRVSTLEGRVNELEIENSILRVNYLLFKS
ncbi:protein bunched, class 2/F/G isoform isoform X1 [Tribolium castaneum]|uniref:protein bunched, class 2/F/G isoform isoform X1 n=1 Tax=Tribolium castaneum TaxID=7070 RepID=UPI00046C2D05|nr:PREDICTED: protein bunched, class 2/F/G isoform isoform X1 [Tribolium castaneum]|eukprot:XP_008200254.1 PREDICTED: protein bunched, class 2/F/G isoform isoform X1 [Tribolium castaneum]